MASVKKILRKREAPPLFNQFIDNQQQGIVKSFQKDVIWAMTHYVCKDLEEGSVGFWTNFNKETTNKVFSKSNVEYLQTIPQPPDYNVCKQFFDDLLRMMEV